MLCDSQGRIQTLNNLLWSPDQLRKTKSIVENKKNQRLKQEPLITSSIITK
jgi:hypothetical protein